MVISSQEGILAICAASARACDRLVGAVERGIEDGHHTDGVVVAAGGQRVGGGRFAHLFPCTAPDPAAMPVNAASRA